MECDVASDVTELCDVRTEYEPDVNPELEVGELQSGSVMVDDAVVWVDSGFGGTDV